MTKKLFTLFLALTANIGTILASIKIGDLYYNLNEAELTAEVTNPSEDKYSGSISIPSFVYDDGKKYSVTSIGSGAFLGCSGLTSVTIPNSVTSIGDYAFLGCSGLTSVTIPNSVTSIGSAAFYGCTGLISVTIPNRVTNISSRAFSGCTGLTSVNIPNSVTSIGEEAFYNVANIVYEGTATGAPWGARSMNGYVDGWLVYKDASKTQLLACSSAAKGEISIPNSVTSIGNYAFTYCTGLTSVTIPNSVTSTGEYTFYGCTGLTSVNIPNSVTSIEESAFSGCTGLASVTIPNSVTSIGGEAFAYCKSLTSVTIPNSLTSIKEYTFRGCLSLTSVTIPSSITSIGGAAFSDCTGLTAVYISDIVAWCGISFNDYGTSNPLKYAHNLYLNGELVKDLVIPESVTSISSSAFSGCTGLTSITIPNTVTSIGEGAFYNVANIVYEGTATGAPWGARSMNGYVDGWLVYKDASKTQLLACSSAAKGEISIPNSVTSIGNYAFAYCKSLSSITIPNSVTSIGKWAFYGCSGLTSVTIPNSVTSIGEYAFSGCTGLTAIEIPSSIASIEESAFSGCTGLTAIYISDIAAWCGISFNGLGETPNPLKYAHNLYLNGELVKDLVIPESVTSISSTAFYGCTSITSVTIPNSVISIGSNAFWGCAGLTYIIALPQTPPSLVYSSTFPNSTIIYVPSEYVEAYQSAKYWKDYTIKPLLETKIAVGSTSVSVNVNHNVWNIKGEYITSVGVKGGEIFDGNVLEYNGLEPATEYKDIPVILTSHTGETDTVKLSFKTTQLELATKPSKTVSATTAILLAETNMSDAEVSCGFEYKRNDAPADMDGTKVFCPVASGQMVGRLKNLKDDVYYKYRAFYQSAAGNMYYGDWKYIFTGDVAVEFDPILYTYGATVVKENEATISGYALAGSEDFSEQGFEYWAETRANGGANAPRRMPAALGEHFFVQASGISLRVTLNNLDAGTVYKYRVYGKVGDQYYYGSEQTFTTQGEYIDETTAIEEIQSMDKAVPQAQKVLRNGQIFIIRGEKVYNAQGALLK